MELANNIIQGVIVALLYLALGVGFISLGLKVIRLFNLTLPPNTGLLYGLLVLIWPMSWIYVIVKIIAPAVKKVIYLLGDLVYITAFGDYIPEKKKS